MVKKIAGCLILLFFSPFFANAARLYFYPDNGEFHQNDIFTTQLRIDTQNQNINLGEIDIEFSKDYLNVVNISDAKSLFNLWPKSAIFDNQIGIISLVGGVPNGFNGNGIISLIAFKALADGSAKITFGPTTKILLNDGLGTPAQINFNAADFTILAGSLAAPKNEWEEAVGSDNIPPKSFEVKVEKIEGKYFAIFSTTDQESGIDHYEIREGKGNWKTAASPYLLENQNLTDKILVRAMDKAGNERISEYKPAGKLLLYLAIIITILILAGIIWLIKLKRRRKNAE